ncbi:MAG: class I SAM-dependent RNA methyltransferase [Pseudomonadota bacterium]
MADPLDIFLVCVPGLEDALLDEALALGFGPASRVHGGVSLKGGLEDVWRANLWLRGATRVLVRLGSFPARTLADLEHQGARFPWHAHLAAREPVRLDVTCRKSKIAHAGAAAAKLERALRVAQIPVIAKAPVTLKIRIERDLCHVSVDSSGESLHKRGHKAAVGKAPLRETMAALILRRAGHAPGEPVVDPFCGSGTLPLEAADLASGRAPGRDRGFAFERLPSFNAAAYRLLPRVGEAVEPRCFGYDRDAGAVRNARANAKRAGLSCTFAEQPVGALSPPTDAPGLVICNPPYGIRIGEVQALHGLYATLGARLRDFAGWRVAILTSEARLAQATGLDFAPEGPPIAHGGLKVWLFQAGPL